MKKQEKYNELQKKFFWEQKRLEVGKAICILAFIVLVPLIVGNLVQALTLEYFPYPIWFIGFFCTFFGGVLIYFIGLILYVTIEVLKDWIENNWDLAGERAKEQLKEEKK